MQNAIMFFLSRCAKHWYQCIHITIWIWPKASQDVWYKINFQAAYSWFEILVFLLLNRLSYKGQRVWTAPLFGWDRRNEFMAFSKALAKVKRKQPCREFQLGSPILFFTRTTVALWLHQKVPCKDQTHCSRELVWVTSLQTIAPWKTLKKIYFHQTQSQ